MIEKLKQFRKDYQFRQVDAASVVGVKTSTWHSWESGRRNPPDTVSRFIDQYRAINPPPEFDVRTHYVYKVTHTETGRYYIGMRSCRGEPLNDPYIGTSKFSDEMMELNLPVIKEVLAICPDRKSAYLVEQEWFVRCDGDPLCVNKALKSLITPKLKVAAKFWRDK